MGNGEFAALCGALMWTISSMFWGRIHLPAMTLNFAKNIVGVGLFLIHLLVITQLLGTPVFQANAVSWFWLALSGVVGIVIGDAFYFRSLQILGPRLALMMATTSPIFSIVISSLVLNEIQTFSVVAGILLTVIGVVVVVSDRKAAKEAPGLMPGTISWGVWTGIIGAICQAAGGVLAKLGLEDQATGENICDPLEGAFIRVLIATIGTTVVVLARGGISETMNKVFAWSQLKLIIPATAIGTWLGIWLSQIAYQQSDAAIAQTLLATCPLFAIPIVWYSGKNKLTVISVLGTIAAIVGIFIAVGGDLRMLFLEPLSWFSPAAALSFTTAMNLL